MNLCENQVFLVLRAKAVNLLNENEEIGNCCTVDCIVGVLKKYYNDLALEEEQKTKITEITEILEELNKLDEIGEQELKEFYENCLKLVANLNCKFLDIGFEL